LLNGGAQYLDRVDSCRFDIDTPKETTKLWIVVLMINGPGISEDATSISSPDA